MKTKTFKTVKELVDFVKEFKDKDGKTLDVNYFKLTVALRTRRENRTVDKESNKYIDRELGTIDSITDMKRAENIQRPVETKWMIQKSTTMINKPTKRRSNVRRKTKKG